MFFPLLPLLDTVPASSFSLAVRFWFAFGVEHVTRKTTKKKEIYEERSQKPSNGDPAGSELPVRS